MEKKQFYKMVFSLVLPMAVQNLINVGVTAADVIMLGRVGETALSAASLANQISFILNLLMFGLTSGAAVLTAQYWGRKDTRTIEKVMGMSFRFAIIVGLLFGAAAIFIPGRLMLIFTKEDIIIAEGIRYLRIVGFSYLLMSVNMVYLNLMRSVERVLVGMVTYAVSLLVNVIVNAIFIFGLLGAPKLGTAGAAIGTLTARCIELVSIVLYDRKYNDVLNVRIRDIFVRDGGLRRDFVRYAMPVAANELIWGSGMAMISAVMGHLGGAAVAAHSVAQTSRQLAMVVSLGVSGAAAIILGKTIGEGRRDLAKVYASRFMKLSLIVGIAGGLFIFFAVRPVADAFLVLTGEAREYLGYMMFIMSYFCVIQSVSCTLIVGILRSGGDTRIGLILDVWGLWGCSIILGAVAAFILKLPVPAVYALITCDEAVKFLPAFKRYRSYKWLKDVTR